MTFDTNQNHVDSSVHNESSSGINETSSSHKDSTAGIEQVLAPLRKALVNVYFPAKTPDGHPSISRFFIENRRLPFITDKVKPWDYPGWLLAYVILCSERLGPKADRWGYYFRTLDAGQLLDEPLPEVQFAGSYMEGSSVPLAKQLGAKSKADNRKAKLLLSPSQTYAHLNKICEHLGGSFGYGERSLYALVDWLCWGLGVEKAKPNCFDEKTNEYLYRTFDVSGFLLAPYDYLGDLLQEYRGKSKNWTGFFLTPQTVCDFMAQMLCGKPGEKDLRRQTVNEPAVGTGRMLLAMSNYSMRLSGQDIDLTCIKICKINAALYVPWMAFPLPESYFEDNAPGQIENVISPVILPVAAEQETNQEIFECETATSEADSLVSVIDSQACEIRNCNGQAALPAEKQKRKKYGVNENQGLLFDLE